MFFSISVFVLQVDLEPEGKVYIHVNLTGSFVDGKSPLSHLHSSFFLSQSFFLLNFFMQK